MDSAQSKKNAYCKMQITMESLHKIQNTNHLPYESVQSKRNAKCKVKPYTHLNKKNITSLETVYEMQAAQPIRLVTNNITP